MPPSDNVSNSVLDAALRLQGFCRERGWRFCFIGGLAVQKWSEPRVTDDVDLTLFTGFGSEGPYVAEDLIVLKTFAARPQDWRDVEMTIVRQGDKALDWPYIHRQLRPLLEAKETPELLDQLEGLRQRLRRAQPDP